MAAAEAATASPKGSYDDILEQLRSSDGIDEVLHACEALSKKVFNSEVQKVLAGRAGGIDAVLGCARAHPESVRIQTAVMKVLRHLAFRVEANVLSAVEAGAIPLVVAALRSHAEDENLVAEAVWALSVLAKHAAALPLIKRLLPEIASAGARHSQNGAIHSKVQYVSALAEVVEQVSFEVRVEGADSQEERSP